MKGEVVGMERLGKAIEILTWARSYARTGLVDLADSEMKIAIEILEEVQNEQTGRTVQAAKPELFHEGEIGVRYF